jgi:dihydroflavonol-4-reductase
MQYFITGATGFLGSYVARMLVQKGRKVRALRRTTSPMDMIADVADQIEWVDGDVNDVGALADAMEGVTHVIHAAAVVSFHPKDARMMTHINVEGTANMVNLALDCGVQRFVHVSSIAALGRDKTRERLDEKSAWVESSGNTNYAISKYRSEQEAWRGWAEGLPVAIVNPAIILGSGFWHTGTSKFFKQLHDGLKFCPVGRSGFVDVRDVAACICLLAESDITGQRYILNVENTLYKDFFTRTAAFLNTPPPSITVQPWLAEVAWRVEWLKEKLLGTVPVVTKESARSSVSTYYYDNAKSLTIPGFSYRPLDTTLRETAEQYLLSVKEGKRAMVLEI